MKPVDYTSLAPISGCLFLHNLTFTLLNVFRHLPLNTLQSRCDGTRRKENLSLIGMLTKAEWILLVVLTRVLWETRVRTTWSALWKWLSHFVEQWSLFLDDDLRAEVIPQSHYTITSSRNMGHRIWCITFTVVRARYHKTCWFLEGSSVKWRTTRHLYYRCTQWWQHAGKTFRCTIKIITSFFLNDLRWSISQ